MLRWVEMVKVYVVKAGDTLSKIAEKMLGDANRWQEIAEANRGIIGDPDVIKPGTELTIPDESWKARKVPAHDFE